MQFRVPFRVTIISALLVVVAVLTVSSLGNVWFTSSRTAEENAAQLFSGATQSARQQLDDLIGDTMVLAKLGATQTQASLLPPTVLGAPVLQFLLTALAERPALYSLYYGFEDGRFVQVISAKGDENVIAAHKAPAGTRWIVRAIVAQDKTAPTAGIGAHPQWVQSWSFLDAGQNLIGEHVEAVFEYDPRIRRWYTGAMDHPDAVQLSRPYVFYSLQELGITASKRIDAKNGVFGADITLGGLETFVSEIEISDHGGMVLFDEDGRILSMSANLGPHAELAQLESMRSPALQILSGAIKAQSEGRAGNENSNWKGYLIRHDKWPAGGRFFHIAVIAPMADFVSHIVRMQTHIFIIMAISLAVFLPVAFFLSIKMSRVISELAADANRIRTLDFTGKPFLESRIIEFYELGRAFISMKVSLQKRTTELEIAEEKLSRLVELGIAMSDEYHADRLMDMIVVGAKEISRAEGGTLYIIGKNRSLEFRIFHNDRLDLHLDSESEGSLSLPAVPLFDDSGAPNYKNVVSHCVHERKTVNITDAYDSTRFDFSGTQAFDAQTGYRSQSFITIPLKPRGGDVIGALQLINARGADGEGPIPFSAEIQVFAEALAAQAATALENRNLLSANEHFMDSLIEFIAGAIDAKSPYTGGHCARVPELAMMLAEEASQSDDGPFADFHFDTEEEWREFRIGALLHDCGKVTTPEHVVDKATKLETIYNRIHEVRTRFEVLLRDAEIDKLKAVMDGENPEDAARRYDDRKQQLIADFAFVARCNIGGEFITPEDVARLEVIADTPWQRNFDNRLGLSVAELKRHSGSPDELPVTENLLQNAAYHVVPRDDGTHSLFEQFGFKVQIPKNLFDYGEVSNLSISRGTLSNEERFKVNEHIVQTIVMLERLPFPKQLSRVPEYAGTHHEALDGSGYPRKLTGEELSIPARIMAIADIFEALTAADRPYKKAKPLSESLRILHIFKQNGHIDPDLFDLFLKSGAYQRYAERFLPPSQIDDVEVEQYLG